MAITTAPAAPTQARVECLRARLHNEGLEGLLISQPENRRYLSGFTGSAGYLLITQERALLIVDFRYVQQAGEQALGYEVVKVEGRFPDLLPRLVSELAVARLGFEADGVTYATYSEWLAALQERSSDQETELAPTRRWVETLRAVKDAGELASIEAAIKLADDAVVDARSWLRPGLTEKEVAWRLESSMRQAGADGVAFPLIVAGGPAAAMPHAAPSDRPVQKGEPIVIDMGARLNGYCSDLTRTVCLGEPDSRFWEIYRLVLEAQQKAEREVRAGMTGAEAHAIAWDHINAAGYGEAFGHGLGHSVGLAIHEDPRMSKIYTERLEPGTVITVEPGVYVPGWGGVRIEDNVVVTEDGCEVLTHAPKDLIEL
jgi:Xaa-Pro aminopeptidase